MPVATEDRIRSCLIEERYGEAGSARRLASVIAGEINEVDRTKADANTVDRQIQQIRELVAQQSIDFARHEAQMSQMHSQFVSDMQELERRRDERERQRDERERERLSDSQEFQRRIQAWGYALFGLWLASVGALAAVIALVM